MGIGDVFMRASKALKGVSLEVSLWTARVTMWYSYLRSQIRSS